MARRATLKIKIQWDDVYWLATDSIWAYGTGDCPEAAVASCLAQMRLFVADTDGSDLAGPALQQYTAYRRFLDQANKAVVLPPPEENR